MRKYVLTLSAAIAAACLLASCGSSDKRVPTAKETFRSALTAEDTTQMLALCDSCMELLRKGDVEAALSRIHLYDDSTRQVMPLSEEKAQQLRSTFRMFPVLNYRVAYFSFVSEGVNDVKYDIEFFEKPEGDNRPNTIGFMFNPVKVDGAWYITVKDADQAVDALKS